MPVYEVPFSDEEASLLNAVCYDFGNDEPERMMKRFLGDIFNHFITEDSIQPSDERTHLAERAQRAQVAAKAERQVKSEDSHLFQDRAMRSAWNRSNAGTYLIELSAAEDYVLKDIPVPTDESDPTPECRISSIVGAVLRKMTEHDPGLVTRFQETRLTGAAAWCPEGWQE